MSYGSEEFPDGKGRPRYGNPRFYDLLGKLAELHDKKSHDYASNDNPSGNYHFAGQLASMFSHSPEDAGFIGRIAEKIYRLANLESGGKRPQNESIEDTERDICVITLLWMTDRADRRNKPNRLENELLDLIKLMPDFQQDQIVKFILEMQAIRARRDSEARSTREEVVDRAYGATYSDSAVNQYKSDTASYEEALITMRDLSKRMIEFLKLAPELQR
jgi:hypothetical protein